MEENIHGHEEAAPPAAEPAHECCWHGRLLLTSPGHQMEVCCWCGAERAISEAVREEAWHGPHRPVGLPFFNAVGWEGQILLTENSRWGQPVVWANEDPQVSITLVAEPPPMEEVLRMFTGAATGNVTGTNEGRWVWDWTGKILPLEPPPTATPLTTWREPSTTILLELVADGTLTTAEPGPLRLRGSLAQPQTTG